MATQSNAYALLVGINDYSTFDRSVGSAPGSSDLRGSIEDALTWLRVCRHFCIPPQNIQVLTGPVLSPEQIAALDAEGVTFGAADRAGLVAGTSWLTEKLGDESRPAGVIFLGGHCHFEGGRSLLAGKTDMGFCPGDVVGVRSEDDPDDIDMQGTISLLGLKAQFAEAGNDNLTLIADFCHVPRMPRLLMRWKRLRMRRSGEWPGIGTRMLTACRPSERSAEAMLDGRWQGAFTWAASNALLQWQRRLEDGVVRSTVSYGRLVKAVDAVLDGMGFDQECSFAGAPPRLPVFHPGLELHPGETSRRPDARTGDRQISAGTGGDLRVYQFDLGSASVPGATPTLGILIATNTASPSGSYQADCEYYRFSEAALSQMASQGYTVWVADCSWQAAQTLPTLNDVITWTPPQGVVWASGRLITIDETVAGPVSSAGLYRGETPGITIGTRFDFVQGPSSPPILTWFHEDTGYVFDNVPGADLTVAPGPDYHARFAPINRVAFVADSEFVSPGWHAYGSESVPDATALEP